MSMLAGPRRKQKIINLRAKNNEWSNDSNKFGQRMLEKMGWTSGKGLGANENGIVEHVVARFKNDEKGLGFEDKNDQWTKHEDDFNSLLANLSNDNDSVKKLHSGISLEDKSKRSKARIHYHKFTRGKDLSQYSEKDLANIFGKKNFKEEKVNETQLLDDVKTTEQEQVFTEKGSMEDYFKNKMAAIKSKNNKICIENDNSELDWDDEPTCEFQGFVGTTDNEDMPNNKVSSLNNIDNCDLKNDVENDADANNFKNQSKTKKKKKKKCKEDKNDELVDWEKVEVLQKCNTLEKELKEDAKNHIENIDVEIKIKKKKRRHEKGVIVNESDVEQSLLKPKKKKKRKNKDL